LITIRTLGTKIDADRVQYSDAVMNMSVQQLYDLGYEMYIEPTTMIGIAANAMWQAAQQALRSGSSITLADQHGNLYDLLEKWMDVKTVRDYRARYVNQSAPDSQGA
jgi:2-methylisocitrate lyase-like PEP mutase family enzyme